MSYFKKYKIFFCIISSFICASAFSSNQTDTNQSFVQKLKDFCQLVQQQVSNRNFPIKTDGIEIIDNALENNEFFEFICTSKEDGQVDMQCATGAFSLKNELIGLKNSLGIYNDSESPYALHMIRSDIGFILFYLTR